MAGKIATLAKNQGGRFRRDRVAKDVFLGVCYLQHFHP